jgi:hypothetical protein
MGETSKIEWTDPPVLRYSHHGMEPMCDFADLNEENLVALPVWDLLLGAKYLFVAAAELFCIIRKQFFGGK